MWQWTASRRLFLVPSVRRVENCKKGGRLGQLSKRNKWFPWLYLVPLSADFINWTVSEWLKLAAWMIWTESCSRELYQCIVSILCHRKSSNEHKDQFEQMAWLMATWWIFKYHLLVVSSQWLANHLTMSTIQTRCSYRNLGFPGHSTPASSVPTLSIPTSLLIQRKQLGGMS